MGYKAVYHCFPFILCTDQVKPNNEHVPCLLAASVTPTESKELSILIYSSHIFFSGCETTAGRKEAGILISDIQAHPLKNKKKQGNNNNNCILQLEQRR